MRHTWLVGWFKVAKAKVVTPRPNWGILKMSFPRLKITFEQTCRISHSVSNNWKRVMKASFPVKLIWNLSFYLFFPSFSLKSTTNDISIACHARKKEKTKWRRTPPCAEADRLIASTASACVVVRMNRERRSKSFRTPLLTCHTCTCTRYTCRKTKGDDPVDDSNFHRGPGRSQEEELLKHFR
ncbi:hypothetical protein ALC60_12452 [Trachymyrmex zeteki]|uniref:Uncharacterized protein n=1 Tax=Mycetomoellerius zeteki TaxID=64791 RepID=A0A151WKX6_9HYME|nr:hypothetical protein ALC60_12452 [Trachymyrmex zeteki]